MGWFHIDLPKPTTVTSIEVSLVSTWKTLWDGGLPPTYEEHVEENVELETMDLLYSDKLVMAMPPVSVTPSMASDSSSEIERKTASPLSFTSVTNLLRKNLKLPLASSSSRTMELPAGQF